MSHNSEVLTFSGSNAKTAKIAKTLKIPQSAIVGLALPSGFTCPGALDCLSRAMPDKSGKVRVKDGRDTKFRCYSATLEARFPTLYALVWRNFDLLKSAGLRDVSAMKSLILDSIDTHSRGTIQVMRLHVNGDFMTREYMQAWVEVAKVKPDITFYGYTKSNHFWVSLRGAAPDNFGLVTSVGGKYDRIIQVESLVSATVVGSEADAERLGLEIDHDESLAMAADKDYALLLHGTQPAGSQAAKDLEALKRSGFTGYSRDKK